MAINPAFSFRVSKPREFLKRVLLVDAATCIAFGALCSLASNEIAALTGIAPAILLYAGLSLFPIALFMLLVAAQPRPALVLLAVLGNAGWVAGSLLMLTGAVAAPNALGTAFILLQALTVAVLAVLEGIGLRRLGAA